MRQVLIRAFNLLFGCRHRNLTRIFTLEGQTYRVCLKCGARIPWHEPPLPHYQPKHSR